MPAREALGIGRGAELRYAEIRRTRAGFLAVLGSKDDTITAEPERALALARRQQARGCEDRISQMLAERSLNHGGAHR